MGTLWTATNTPLLRHFSIFLSSLPLLHPLSSCPPPPCSPRSPPRSAPLSPSPPGPWPPPMWSDNSPTIQRMLESKCSGLPMCRAREWTTSAPVPSSPQSRRANQGSLEGHGRSGLDWGLNTCRGGRDWWNLYRRNDCLRRDVVQFCRGPSDGLTLCHRDALPHSLWNQGAAGEISSRHD